MDKDKLKNYDTGFQALINKGLSEAKPRWPRLALKLTSTKGSEEYGWGGGLDSLREWVGERQVQELAAHTLAIKNRKFELTVGVKEDDLADDNLGIYGNQLEAMGQQAAMHPDKLVFELLNSGFAEKCYDGKPLFAPDHPGEKGAWSNKSTAALSLDAYKAARASVLSRTTRKGEPLDLQLGPDNCTLVVGPENEGMGRDILEAATLDNKTNTMRNTANLEVSSRVKNGQWYLLVTHLGLRSVIYQERRAPRVTVKDKVNDELVFWEGKVIYGVDYRGNAGYGLPELAYGSTGTGV